jgi:1-acyl-sn-glycerol-3-phosphate acyltransferase
MDKILSAISQFIMRLMGWRIEGTVPSLSKMVIIGAHHTSNWDALFLILGAFAVNRRIYWLVKHTLMRPPLSWLIKALNGIPVDRTTSSGVVGQAVDIFKQRDEFILLLSPEGTRRKVTRWKRGFYYIAMGAGVPIVPVAIDYRLKVLRIGKEIYPTGDLEADMEIFREFYRGTTPRYPEKAGDIIIAPGKRDVHE